MVWAPTWATLRPVKVARPLASVSTVVVPESVPPPDVKVSVIGTLAWATLVPVPSRSATWTLKGAPAATLRAAAS